MMTFAYQARDGSGKIISGVQEALNEENAINTLMSRGLMVLQIQQKAGGRAACLGGKATETELVLFTRQLATMVDAGIPLVSALTGLFEQSDPRRQVALRRTIGDITARVQQGDSFNESLTKHPRVFSRLYCSMVKAGESGGLLAEILDRLAGFLESTARLKKKVKSALTYPVVVLVIAFGIAFFLILKVVPVFADVYKDFGSALPAPTQVLVNFSEWVQVYWWVMILIGIGVHFGTRQYIRTKSGRETWDKLKLKLPVFGPLIHKIIMTRFARTFAQLIRSGVPILEVLDITGETSDNIVVEKALKEVGTDIEKGDQLTAALSRHPVFPPMMLRMVGAGEATGKIDQMLEKMADFWDEEIEATLNALTSLLEPMLIVLLGLIVGSIVICMFLPIFKLSDLVSGQG